MRTRTDAVRVRIFEITVNGLCPVMPKSKVPARLHEITGTLNIDAPDVRSALYGRNRSWDGGDEHVAPAPSIGGNTIVTLADGSTVTLVGVSSINSSFFG